MHGKKDSLENQNRFFNYFILLAVLLVISGNVSGQQVFVTLEPVGKTGTVELYPLETAEYNLVAVNSGPEKIENLDIYLTADNGITFISSNGTENPSQRITFSGIPPNGREFKGIKVKALSTSLGQPKIKGEFTLSGNSVYNFTTTILVIQTPLDVVARIENSSLSRKEAGVIFLDLKNSSQSPITSLNAEISVPEGFSITSGSFFLGSLQPGQSVQSTQFKFIAPDYEVKGANVKLLITYSDERGKHSLEKDFSVDVGDRSGLIMLLIAGIVVLVVISIYLKTRGTKKK